MLDKQVLILSVDTGGFYSNREAYLHWLNKKRRMERKKLVEEKNRIIKELEKFEGRDLSENDFERIYSGKIEFSELFKNDEEIKEKIEIEKLYREYEDVKKYINIKNKQIKVSKEKLLKLLSNKVNSNIETNGKHHIRELRNISPVALEKADIWKNVNKDFSGSNIISVFNSYFTRTIGAEIDELSEDFMVIQVYYFDIIKDLIYYGFTYKGEKYKYFTSSAGQIRTKKTVFVKESVWNRYEKTLMCGLTLDRINERSGCNQNKFLAYLALTNSATDEWNNFDIDRTVVIDDFETNVPGEYDFIDEIDYTITRTQGDIPIPHTDGCGMILPNAFGEKQVNKMVRMCWVKGLLGVFDFRRFIEENNCSPIITDIYGKEHDLIAENIQVILTKSQFKMYKYFDSWSEYQDNFKKYDCKAAFTNPEEERIKDVSITYQMLQSLTNITNEEIDILTRKSSNKLRNLASSVDSMKNSLGVDPYNTDMTYLQKSIMLYPDLMNDEYIKNVLRNIKNSLIKRYKSGCLSIEGKYTFILPDLYAACEYWFMGTENPKGLLDGNEVFCWLFRKSEKLDCLRSPHLSCEHFIGQNMAWNGVKEKQEQIRKWFCTNALYTSTHSYISKILQFDVDGDTSLVVADKTLIKIAERNIKIYDIVPLYYNMKKAPSKILTNQSIYDGLNAAFTHGNIGIYSNNISKIWNSDTFTEDNFEKKMNAIKIIKLLCMENNFQIDCAKTLYMPTRPKWFSEELKHYTNNKLPHFFKYAKDKMDNQIEKPNKSFVNKLNTVIPSPRISTKNIKLDEIDYKKMVSNPDIKVKVSYTRGGKIIEEKTDPMILKYYELNKKYCFKIDMKQEDVPRVALRKSQLKQQLIFGEIAREIKCELSKFGYTEQEVVDILVKLVYHIKPSSHKGGLWFCYGKYIYENLQQNYKLKIKYMQCDNCGKWFETSNMNNKSNMCEDCYKEYRRNYKAQKERERRERLKRGQTEQN